MKKAVISREIRQSVISRADNCCEYCLLPAEASLASLQVDHVIPESQGGPTLLENLALACPSCNVYKGYHVVKYYYESGKTVLLFNPRKELWVNHFNLLETGVIASLSETGLATIEVLQLNKQVRVEGRMGLIKQGILSVANRE